MDNNIHINPESIEKFKAFKDIPIPEGYESPITGYMSHFAQQVIEQREDAVVAQIREQIGINVDKDELVRALNYDRNRFDEGYRKGYFAAERKHERDNWIEITTRPMTDEEYAFYIDRVGDAPYEDCCIYTCKMPDDNEEVQISTKWGGIYQDIYHHDADGSYFEDHDDMDDVTAWRPLPEPFKNDAAEDQDLGGEEND